MSSQCSVKTEFVFQQCLTMVIVLKSTQMNPSLSLFLLCFIPVMTVVPGVDLTEELRELKLWDGVKQ